MPREDSDKPAHSHIQIKILAGHSLDSKRCKWFHEDKENSDQIARMQRVRKVFVDSTCQKVRLSTTGVHLVVSKLFTLTALLLYTVILYTCPSFYRQVRGDRSCRKEIYAVPWL